jgi:hypothetical protein
MAMSFEEQVQSSRQSVSQLTYNRLVKSRAVVFHVGPERTPVLVHASAIAAASSSLGALIDGTPDKPRPRSVRCKDVQLEEFVRFCEWAYRGDYTVALPKDCSHAYRYCPEKVTELQLFAHVRLYIFAHDHLIKPLKDLAASKLEKILHNPEPCECYINGVLAFAGYVYRNDADRDSWDKLVPISSMVMKSIVRLCRTGDRHWFLYFLEEGGTRASDFCQMATMPEMRAAM